MYNMSVGLLELWQVRFIIEVSYGRYRKGGDVMKLVIKKGRTVTERDVFSVQEMSKYLGIGESLAYQLCHTPSFPVLRIGRRMLIPCKQLEEWLAANVAD